jgi:hypothetical protein
MAGLHSTSGWRRGSRPPVCRTPDLHPFVVAEYPRDGGNAEFANKLDGIGWKIGGGYVAAFDVDGKNLGVVFETTTPCSTPGQMAALIAWPAKALSDQAVHSLINIAVFMVSFLATRERILLGVGRELAEVNNVMSVEAVTL